MKKTILTGLITAVSFALGAPALAQTVQTQDVSAQLQAGLEASAPTIVYFGYDKDNIDSDAEAILTQQANWLRQNPNAKVDLAGHTDATGSNDYNFDLAMRRARSVETFLLQQGVSPAQMRSVVSQGETSLAVETQAKERLNRRVRTSVTGLVEIVQAAPPAPVYTPPPARSYADSSPLTCSSDTDRLVYPSSQIKELRAELTSRMNAAAAVYDNPTYQASTSNIFNLASFTKTECGIAIGYTKENIIDQRSIDHCACYAKRLAELAR